MPGIKAELEALRQRHAAALELMGERDEEVRDVNKLLVASNNSGRRNNDKNVGLVVVGGTSSGYSGLEGNVQGASEHAGEQGKSNIHQSVVKLFDRLSWSQGVCAFFNRSNEKATKC